MLGVGAVNNDVKSMIVSGLAGLVAGACSMAIGEFVSVFSQRDSELADVEKERQVAKNNNNFKTISSIESWVFVLRFVHDHCHGPKKTF
jgi:VIT1/CCC1 family predicted Fe2+/Mn2+ transporter